MISIIAALSKNYTIGNKGKIPWHLGDDMKNFARLTKGGSVIMGRKTYESIIKHLDKPLPDRKNIVISRNADYKLNKAIKVRNLEEAIKEAGEGEIFVIGGSEIYKLALDMADKMYLTHVEAIIEGDAKFPNYKKDKWINVQKEKHLKNDVNDHDYTYAIYQRKR